NYRFVISLLQTLLFFLSVQTFAEVMESVSDCDRFFLDQTPPHVPDILEGGRILDQNQYKLICQTYGQQRRFVTLYDVQNRIPVFSAFKVKRMIPGDTNRTYNHQAADKESTFTLTNVVPQAESFNKGSWNNMERCVNVFVRLRSNMDDFTADSLRFTKFILTREKIYGIGIDYICLNRVYLDRWSNKLFLNTSDFLSEPFCFSKTLNLSSFY
uniref:DNA/RNA non-specific endonuclease/pyrophosphatase/phosphodiesterase domain-containing protein n=1 Tax=Xiphophorus couchianus TaxID=32473 RepID=A0A3B5LK17_9TELE